MDYSYMPDQTRYIFYTDYFRFITDQKEINYDIGFGDEFFLSKTGFTSYLLSLIPMPNIMTTRSLGFANKIIFIILFSYLYKKQILTNFTAYIFLIYPSFALYSGIALKEMISVCLMILIIERSYNFNIKQLPILIFLCFACYIVKYQFMLFIAPFVLILLINFYDFKKKGYSYLIYSSLIIFGIIIGFFLVQRYGDYINNIRYSFFIDNGNNPDNFIYLKNYFEFITFGLMEFLKTFIEPLPNINNNFYRNIQFVENIFIAGILIGVTYLSFKRNFRTSFLWIFYLFFSVSITSIIVDNIGTLSRYKFPLILTYIIFISYAVEYAKKKN
tara:strand:+ start:5138 stop:6127 length:990 start_codon:yes stop_codon:yes gene_type:complete